jgi:hypothetical protein
MGHRPPRLRSDLAGALVGALVGVVGVYLATFLNQTHWFLTHGFVPLGGP